MQQNLDDYPVLCRFPVHWGEMDALGHVNHIRYIAWFETARIQLFERVGVTDVGRATYGPILAHVECDYAAPVKWPADVIVGARFGRIGRTSMVNEYAVFVDGEAHTLVAHGQAVVVLYDYKEDRKMTVPDALRAEIAALSAK